MRFPPGRSHVLILVALAVIGCLLVAVTERSRSPVAAAESVGGRGDGVGIDVPAPAPHRGGGGFAAQEYFNVPLAAVLAVVYGSLVFVVMRAEVRRASSGVGGTRRPRSGPRSG